MALNPEAQPLDLTMSLEQVTSLRDELPGKKFNTAYIRSMQCQGQSAFLTDPRSSSHLLSVLILRWGTKDYKPDTTSHFFFHEVAALLKSRHKNFYICRGIFSETALEVLRRSHSANQVLAVVLNDIYDELWASWDVEYQDGDDIENPLKMLNHLYTSSDNLFDASPALRAWSRTQIIMLTWPWVPRMPTPFGTSLDREPEEDVPNQQPTDVTGPIDIGVQERTSPALAYRTTPAQTTTTTTAQHGTVQEEPSSSEKKDVVDLTSSEDGVSTRVQSGAILAAARAPPNASASARFTVEPDFMPFFEVGEGNGADTGGNEGGLDTIMEE